MIVLPSIAFAASESQRPPVPGAQRVEPKAKGSDYSYYEAERKLKGDVVAKEQQGRSWATLAEYDPIDTSGFRTIRVFFNLIQDDFYKNKGVFTSEAKVFVTVFHNTKNASSGIESKEFLIENTTGGNGYTEVPVLGPSSRVFIYGKNLPNKDMTLTTSIYLIK